MALHLPGGWDETTRGTGTGGVQDLGYRNALVGLKTIVQTPNASATVMLTCEPGECSHFISTNIYAGMFMYCID